MRNWKQGITMIVIGLLAVPASAEPPTGQGPQGGRFRDPERHQQMLEQFDTDGDGVLSETERVEMRAEMRERFGQGGQNFGRRGRGQGGPPGNGQQFGRRGPGGPSNGEEGFGGPRGPRGRGGPPNSEEGYGGPRGPRGRGGPQGPPPELMLEPLFIWFDSDHDHSLSRQEYMALSQFVSERMPGPPEGRNGPGRRGRGGRNFDGPPSGDSPFGRRGPQGRGPGPGGPPPGPSTPYEVPATPEIQ